MSTAREISVCLQQGRLYFEAAEAAPIQIKPLQIYYGVVAFAQAVIVATRGSSLSTLARSHGLSDVTSAGAGIESLALRFENAGTFQEFSDAIAPLGGIHYFDKSMPRLIAKAFDGSRSLRGQQVTIREILSRVPGLSGLYQQTFTEAANNVPIMLRFEEPPGGQCTLRIDDPDLYSTREELVATILRWRAAYPFLTRWRFLEATHAWGNAILVFDNEEGAPGDDLSADYIVHNGTNEYSRRVERGGTSHYIRVEDILPPLSGGIVDAPQYAMRPLAGVLLPEYSLQVLGCFLLSSLVRYRPQVWQNTISRSVTAQTPADDRSLSLIEKFLDDVLVDFPKMVVRIMHDRRFLDAR